MRLRLLRAGLLIAVASSGCTTEPSEAFGTWVATSLIMTPTGGAPIDLLQAGATLSISIDAENVTTGNLEIPAGVAGVQAVSASMAGTAIVTETTVRFDQSASTFVRDLVWSRGELTLFVTNQSAGSAAWTITLSKT